MMSISVNKDTVRDILLEIQRRDYGQSRWQMELDVGVEMNTQEHTRILEWFRVTESKTLRPLFYYSWE
jgi:hypothetical protein